MESGKLTKKAGYRLRTLVLSLCAIVAVTGFADSALAQNNQGKSASGTSGNPRITVKGRITDDHDEPLPGANVLVKGTSVGTSADADGNYSLTFQRSPGKSDILIFSFIAIASFLIHGGLFVWASFNDTIFQPQSPIRIYEFNLGGIFSYSFTSSIVAILVLAFLAPLLSLAVFRGFEKTQSL